LTHPVPARLALLTLIATVAAWPAAAQAWHPEIGLRGGLVRLKPTGTGRSDQVDLLDLPGGDYLGQVQSQSALYLVIPLGGRLALEPSLSFQQNTPALIVGTMALMGLRADVALGRGFFAAVGGALRYRDASTAAFQPGVQGAVGWGAQLMGPVSLRVEAQVTAFRRTSLTFPYDAYALLVGMSTRLDDRPPPPSARRKRRPIWEPMVGVQGGYYRLHVIGAGEDIAVLSLPGNGSGSLTGVFAPGPAPFFFVVPLGGPLALEVGADAHRSQSSGPVTVFTGQIAPRVDWALGEHWYVAAGGRFHLLKGTGTALVAPPGVAVATGYRVEVTADVIARAELSYNVDRERSDFGVSPTNSLSFTVGLMVAPVR
jgi:hypothetical protein